MLLLRVPNERQMGVENEREISHRRFQISDLKLRLCFNLKLAIRNLKLQCATEILEPIETFFDDVDAGRVAQANGAVIAESGARDHRDVRFAQEAVGEILSHIVISNCGLPVSD